MKKCFFLAAMVGGLNLAWSLYTPTENGGDQVTAYKVPSGSIVVDGKMDDAWKSITTQTDGVNTMRLNDYSKVVILDDRNADPATRYSAPSYGGLHLMAAYDSSYFYMYILIREVEVFNGADICPDANAWKADAVEIFIDPSPWSETAYKNQFSPDARGAAFGTSANTIQINKPIHPADQRVFLNHRQDNNQFDYKTLEEFKQVYPNFEIATAFNSEDNRVVGVELKIDRWGNPAYWREGNSMYVTWGYNNYARDLSSDCTESPYAYRWAKNYKKYPSTPISERPPGWTGSQDSTHYDPTRSWDGWGKMELTAGEIQVRSDLTLECEINFDCAGNAPPPPPPDTSSSIRFVNRGLGNGMIQEGHTLRLSNVAHGVAQVHGFDGRHLGSHTIRDHRVDLREMQLDPGFYFIRVEGELHRFLYF